MKVTKTNLKKAIGRRLAARVLKTWVEDFVDEDTGEVVSIERNEVVIDRETVLEESHIDEILESGVQNILLHKEELNLSDYSIIYNTLQKDSSNSEKEAVLYIYRQLRNAEPADDASAREVITNLFFSEKRYDLGEVGRYRINKETEPLHLTRCKGADQRGHYRNYQIPDRVDQLQYGCGRHRPPEQPSCAHRGRTALQQFGIGWPVCRVPSANA